VGEVVLAEAALAVVPLLSRRAVVALARFLGRAGFFLSRRDRRVALANLDLAFGDKRSAEQKRAIALGSFRNFALVMLDVFWFSRRTRTRLERYVQIEPSACETLNMAPAILVTAHLGNWELLSQKLASLGRSITSIGKPLANPVVSRRLNRLRAGSGQKIAPVRGAVRSMVKELRSGGYVGLLLDQNTPEEEGGVFVDFFGLPVPVADAAGALALRLKVPLVPCFSRHDGKGAYSAYSLPCIRPEEGMTSRALTQAVATVIENEIRRQPDRWLWMYKRWKRIPPGADPGRYPFYARAD
jgi:KDO2-lipid IV(A) lauroyltransferase